MSLPAGTRIGAYEISASIGEGGMGQVYRATDTRLKRQVAFKILPPSVATDPDRLARFQREAEVLASLNHPHIAAIYGIEESEGVRALVMELVEGDDLSERIARGAIPLDDALVIARQIAEALEAAHDQGIIHRDLKPANIKVRSDGTVKVLDFGLAKLTDVETAQSRADVAASPTITSPARMTGVGMILGTAPYMSPEQAKGKPVDRRTDIWAFGCVLYEMLAARRAFDGDGVTDTLAAVLRGEPDWTLLPPLPPTLHTLIRRCLTTDWRRRIASMSTVRFLLDDPAVLSPANDGAARQNDGELQARVDAATAQARRRVFTRYVAPAIAIAALAVVAAGFGLSGDGTPPSPSPVTRFFLGLPEGQVVGISGRTMALSPSGNELAYLTGSTLLIRRLADFEMEAVAAADVGTSIHSPVFSPDGKWIAYYSGAERTVKRISTQGGAALPVCGARVAAAGLDWDASGIIVSQAAGGIVRCNLTGGLPEQLVTVDEGDTALGAQLLPGGDLLLFTIGKTVVGPSRWESARVVVQSLRTRERTTVREGASDARFVGSGHLVYGVGGTVFAAPFDLATKTMRGDPVPVVEGVRRGINGALQLAVSPSGTLVYLPGPSGTTQALRRVAIGNRAGSITGLPVSPAAYSQVRVSPDGTRVALGVDDGRQASILIYALNGTSAARSLTVEGRNRFPEWSPDSQWIAFQSDRGGDLGIYRQRADGSGAVERLTTAAKGEQHGPESWSPDGRHLSFRVGPADATNSTLWILTLADKTSTRFGTVSSTGPTESMFSPDGKWLAYSKGTGGAVSDVNRGIFLQPFPATGAVYQVPKHIVDFHPVWSKSGNGELVFTPAATTGQMVAVRVTTAGGVTFGPPAPFPASVTGDRIASEPRAWDILPDGRFIGITSTTEDAGRGSSPEMRVVLNWFEELKQRVPIR